MSKYTMEAHFTKLRDLLIDDLPDDPDILNFFSDLETDTMKLQEQVTGLVAALEVAEQTMRNLGNGDLTGDAQTIALNSASNMRDTLAKHQEEK